MTEPVEDPFEIAAAHFARLEAGTATRRKRDEFAEWCNAAPENKNAMDAVSLGWNLSAAARDDARVRAMMASTIARYPANDQALPARRWLPALLAASLVAAAALPAGWWLMSRNDGIAHPELATVEATRQEGATVTSDPGRRRKIQLPDGSQVTLDADSSIRIAFAEGRRSIRLERGRAFFAVHKDKSRPFIVMAGRLNAVAVGTAFDVNRRDEREEVTTTEGLVRVVTQIRANTGGHATLVPAGMKLSQNVDGVTLMKVDTAAETAWRDGKIVFSSQCLGDVATQMNRYGSPLLVIDKDAADIAISGVFDLDNSSALAQALQDQGLVRMRVHKDGIGLMRRPQASGSLCTRRTT